MIIIIIMFSFFHFFKNPKFSKIRPGGRENPPRPPGLRACRCRVFQNPIFPVPGKGFIPFPTLPHGLGSLGFSRINRRIPILGWFFGHPKNNKKTTRQKTTFVWQFLWFSDFSTSRFIDFGAILAPCWAISWMIFLGPILHSIFRILLRKKLKLKKRKCSFRIVKYIVSWGSPCWKNARGAWKKQVFFHRFFIQNRLKIDWKIEESNVFGKNR